MISSLIDHYALPQLSARDEILARMYYLVSAVSDIGQTGAKLTRSIFLFGLDLAAAPETKWLHQVSRSSWQDTSFSFQLTAYSLLGIVAPRQAWLKKCEAHVSHALHTFASSAIGVGMEELDSLSELLAKSDKISKTKTFKAALISQFGETTVRSALSSLRYMAAYAMTSKDENETPFMKVLSDGAETSAKIAKCECEALKELFNSSHKKSIA